MIIKKQKIFKSPMNPKTEKEMEEMYKEPFRWTINNPEMDFEYKIFW